MSFNRFCSIGHRGACERKGRHSASWPRVTRRRRGARFRGGLLAAAEVADAAPATALRPWGPCCARLRRCPDCPIPAVRPPAGALLLCCLQDSIAWLAPGASRSPWRARGRLALSALSRGWQECRGTPDESREQGCPRVPADRRCRDTSQPCCQVLRGSCAPSRGAGASLLGRILDDNTRVEGDALEINRRGGTGPLRSTATIRSTTPML